MKMSVANEYIVEKLEINEQEKIVLCADKFNAFSFKYDVACTTIDGNLDIRIFYRLKDMRALYTVSDLQQYGWQRTYKCAILYFRLNDTGRPVISSSWQDYHIKIANNKRTQDQFLDQHAIYLIDKVINDEKR